MKTLLKDIIHEYPGSRLDKYGDFYELFLREDEKLGGLKISGTEDQVKYIVNLILGRKN